MEKSDSVVILITGSRSITDAEKIHSILSESLKSLIISGYENFILVQGEAAGVDLICKEWAVAHNVSCVECGVSEMDWAKYGKSAGIVRNTTMLKESIDICKERNADLKCFAFWDGSSPGTKHMINSIKKAGYDISVELMGTPKTKRLFLF